MNSCKRRLGEGSESHRLIACSDESHLGVKIMKFEVSVIYCIFLPIMFNWKVKFEAKTDSSMKFN